MTLTLSGERTAMWRGFCFILALYFALCYGAHPLLKRSVPDVGVDSSPREWLEAIYQEYWNDVVALDPLSATALGVHEYDRSLGDWSLRGWREQFDVRKRIKTKFDNVLLNIERNQLDEDLSHEDLVNIKVFKRVLQDGLDSSSSNYIYWSVTYYDGPHLILLDLPAYCSFETVQDFDNYLARLRDIPRMFNDVIDLLRVGVRIGWVPPRVVLEPVIPQLQRVINSKPEDTEFYQPFTWLIDSDTAASLRQAGVQIIRDVVQPAFRNFQHYLEAEYIPASSSDIFGVGSLPGGDRFYAGVIQRLASDATVTADDLFALGQSEVARIQAEMDALAAAQGMSFAEYCTALKADPAQHFATAEELLRSLKDIRDHALRQLPQLFTEACIPQCPVEIAATPASRADTDTGAYYIEPSVDCTRPGTFYANTAHLDQRLRFPNEALVLHEAVPGHHLQLSTQLTLAAANARPAFRTTPMVPATATYATSYSEGWALYAEHLGAEFAEPMGVGSDEPAVRFGGLNYEMLRALRLVVDVGLHARGWTKQQALDFMAQHLCESDAEIEAEVNRYIAWPGQALAYKLGELKIVELRVRTAQSLGDNFNLAEFHKVILQGGPLPLDILEEEVELYIAQKKGRR